jgi:SAM-dependent methyltransferase
MTGAKRLSVVCATFDRAALLDRALYTYWKQTLPADDWEYLLVDDGSRDETRQICAKWTEAGVPLRVFSAEELGKPKEPGRWRDGCALRNAVSTHAVGEVLVSTHPEVMLPPTALEAVSRTLKRPDGALWATAIPYWLPPVDVDACGWRDDVGALRTLPGFYDPSWPSDQEAPGAPDYRNQNQETRTDWESEVFWGMEMWLWRRIGGFREFAQWGSVDLDFHARRRALRLRTRVVDDLQPRTPSGKLLVYHQHHDSPRDMVLAFQGVEGASYPSGEAARRAGGLYATYHHGPRERASDGHLGGILGDHLARYEFAIPACRGADVLDAPCGTGYGAASLLRCYRAYVGVDLDAESVQFARATYGTLGEFRAGDLRALPVPDASVDRVLCFEGLEHVPYVDQPRVAAELRRVLRPGGAFLLSTPQRGATAGTPWDASMLDAAGLGALFPATDWDDLTWHHQPHYGTGPDGNPVRPGAPPADAEVMLLSGVKPAPC